MSNAINNSNRAILKNFSQEQHLEFLFRLSSSLQTSLALEQQLQFFFNELDKLIHLNGLDYRHEQYDITVQIGETARHHCHYRLSLQGDSLGEIGFSRSKRFNEKEQLLLESLLSVLIYPVRNALAFHHAVRSATQDPLTQIGNRHSFEQDIQRELLINKRNHLTLSLLVIDIDHFKSINDSLGHATGDRALVQVSNAIRSATRVSDRLYRYGGDEFVVVLDQTDEFRARLVGERIRMKVAEQQVLLGPQQLPMSVSIGAATLLPQDSRDSLFERADQALYRAKQRGRNCVECSLNSVVPATAS